MELKYHQQVALKRLCEPGRHFGALWAEPRSGKTAVALKWVEHTKAKIVIIVAPKIASAVWKTEAENWLSVPYRYFLLTAGHTYPKKASLLRRGVNLLFVNYEQFGRAPFKRLKPYLSYLAELAHGRGAMILDESHLIKNPAAVTGRHIRPLAADWHWRLIMTGTPVTNPTQIDAVYGQWTFLDPSIRQKWASAREFREYFGEWSTLKGFPELIRPRRQYELSQYLQPNTITMTAPQSDVTVRRVAYSLPDTIMHYYTTLKKHAIVTIGAHTVAALNPLTRLIRLRQMVAGWGVADTGSSFTIKESLQRRATALHDILAHTQGKTIIACSHLHEIQLVSKLLSRWRISYAVIHGSVANKNNIIAQFQELSSLRVLLVQPKTISMAVDISVARNIIWYTSDFNYVTYKQTNDRIKLSPANPTVWFLCAKDTVDEDIWITLEKDHAHMTHVIKEIQNAYTG